VLNAARCRIEWITMIQKLAAFFRSLPRPPSKPRRRSTAKYDWDFLITTTWFAVDSEQNVAAFESGMIPPIAMPHIEKWRTIESTLESLPANRTYQTIITKEDVLAAHLRSNRARRQSFSQKLVDMSWEHVSRNASEWTRRGFYQFWGVNSSNYYPPEYDLVGKPLEPIKLDELPEAAKQVIAAVPCSMRFTGLTHLHISELFPETSR